ncbi:MAG: VanZ family protein [Maribacter arcticus]|uniref:VanZ family protein n=1 Tax=Maribacter arcticus TaxID=561365 RepID=UPI003001D69D
MGKNVIYKVLFISWMMFVTFFSLFSFSDLDTSRFDIPHMDKAVHFTFYFVMVLLAFLASIKKELQVNGMLKLLWYIVLFAIVYGIIIEVIQHVATDNRHGDPLDVLANSIGAIVGMLVIRFLFFRKPSLK